MELKQYQRDVLKEVGRFARTYAMTRDAATAYGIFMNAIGLTPGKDGIERYRDDLGGVPKVCVKVPTGGGKTFIGACAIDVLSDALPSHDEVVVWLVPRREILVQTLRNFRNPEHFLRMRLDRDFAGRVEVLDKEDGLRGRSFSAATVGDQLTLFVLSYDSFKNKDGRRAYAENSSLAGLTAYQQDVGTAVDVEAPTIRRLSLLSPAQTRLSSWMRATMRGRSFRSTCCATSIRASCSSLRRRRQGVRTSLRRRPRASSSARRW